MKINVVPTVIAAAISGLIAYALFSFCKCESQKVLLAVGSFLCLFLSLATCMGVRFDTGRTSANTATLAGVFFVLLLILQIIFSFIRFSSPAYILTDGLLVLIMVLVVYAVAKAKQ